VKTKWKLSEQDVAKIIVLFTVKGMCKNDIARIFNVDHSTIHYHIRKHEGGGVVGRPTGSRTQAEYVDDKDFDGETLNRGMSYSEYVERENARRLERQSICQHVRNLCTYRCLGCGRIHTEELIRNNNNQ
jgi:IS30 family transposase